MSDRMDYGEPWVDKTNAMCDTIDDRDGNIVAYGEGVLGDRDNMPDGSGYGRRIVACVNACRTWSTEYLKTIRFDEEMRKATTALGHEMVEHEKTKKERNEAMVLAQELSSILKIIDSTIESSDQWWIDRPNHRGFDRKAIQAAIAKAEAIHG